MTQSTKKQKQHRLPTAPSQKRQLLKDYTLLFIGASIVALSFNLFLNPNQIVAGGISGVSTIIYYLFGIEPAYTQWLINIPLFAIGVYILGAKYGVKAAIGTAVLPLFVYFTKEIGPLTTNPLLASLYGGLVLGIGAGVVFRGGGSTGGTALLAQVINRLTGLSLGAGVLICDGLIILSAGFVFGPERALYALIGLYVTSKTINLVQVGLNYSKVAFIISDKYERVQQAILDDLDRGLTKIGAQGGYTGDDRAVLMCVFPHTELANLKELVRRVDTDAFIIVTDTNEVLGQGFRSNV